MRAIYRWLSLFVCLFAVAQVRVVTSSSLASPSMVAPCRDDSSA